MLERKYCSVLSDNIIRLSCFLFSTHSSQATSPAESPTTDCVGFVSSSAASILHVTSSSVGQTASSPTIASPSPNIPPNICIQILLGSRHQFELVRVLTKGGGHHHILGNRSSEAIESVKLLSIPTTDASAIGAIEGTEVRMFCI